MKQFVLGLFVLFIFSCGTGKTDSSTTDAVKEKYANQINAEDLKEHVYLLSSDILEGRKTGEKRQEMAVNYFTAYYDHIGLSAPDDYPEYTQNIPVEYFESKSEGPSENVVAFIEGNTYPDQVVIISAHYDHLGMKDGEVYNGADDNASGSSALMEIAEAFQMAKKQGNGPKRSVLFLHLTGEEIGLYGSKYYIENPVFSIDSTVADLNIDMVGRVDKEHLDSKEYIYLIGSDRLSTDLHKLSEKINKQYTNLKLDYTYNELDDPYKYYERSDHYNFAQQNIPVIFYFNGTHEDYHKISDTADKIDFELLALRTKLVFYTAWEIANREDRLVLDEK